MPTTQEILLDADGGFPGAGVPGTDQPHRLTPLAGSHGHGHSKSHKKHRTKRPRTLIHDSDPLFPNGMSSDSMHEDYEDDVRCDEAHLWQSQTQHMVVFFPPFSPYSPGSPADDTFVADSPDAFGGGFTGLDSEITSCFDRDALGLSWMNDASSGGESPVDEPTEEVFEGPPPLICAIRRGVPSTFLSANALKRYRHSGITEQQPLGSWAPRTTTFAGVDLSASHGALHRDADIIQEQLLVAEKQRVDRVMVERAAAAASAAKKVHSKAARPGANAARQQQQQQQQQQPELGGAPRPSGNYTGMTSRAAHNAMERDRRISLRDSYETLRLQVPALATTTKASSLQILQGAASCVEQLVTEEQRLLQEIAKLKRAREAILLRRRAGCAVTPMIVAH